VYSDFVSETDFAKDDPWVMRVYSGHSSAEASNELYRTNIERGQTGLSVAFDLPTQMAYGSSHPLAEGEVGRAGVPVDNIEDMARLFQDIPLDKVNTAMTINAPAAWLLSLYCAVADERGIDREVLRGTTQNDMSKEFLSRHLWAFPPEA
jgi:(2R)-ethylmalonyl-CoA mutase